MDKQMSQSTNQIVYVSNVTIEPVTGAIRHAYLPPDKTQVTFGVHNEIAEHYGVDASEAEAHSTTLDYIVAATGG
tara:strand:- start:81 stop:305 length:225 start_codon:yes stop_codon:yes gene_type:complete